MTLLESLVSLAIALGLVVAVLEASRLAASRSAIAMLEVEAATRAERLLSQTGAGLFHEPARREGSEAGGVRWSLAIRPYLPAAKGLEVFEVTAIVTIERGGLAAQQNLTTLRLKPEQAR